MTVDWPAPFGFTHLDWLQWREFKRSRLLSEAIMADLEDARQAVLSVTGISDILRGARSKP